MRQVFGDDVPPFSSTKSMTGHGIGAAGGLELIFCLGMMDKGFVAPSINIETPDPAIEGLPVVTEDPRSAARDRHVQQLRFRWHQRHHGDPAGRWLTRPSMDCATPTDASIARPSDRSCPTARIFCLSTRSAS